MIKLINEVNKIDTLRKLHKKAEKMYENSYKKEILILGYIGGVMDLFNELQIKNEIINK